MIAREKLNALMASLLLDMAAKLESRFQELMKSASADLAAAKTASEAQAITQRIVDELIIIIDAEEARAIRELLSQSKVRIH